MNFIKDARGLRNNNPGNIRLGIEWKGEVKGDDTAFEKFKSVEYGIRAIYKLISAYASKHGINTIHGIINRYAPSSENATDQYIQSVIKYMLDHAKATESAILLKNKDQTVIDDLTLRTLFVAAIINHENGIQPFNLPFIEGCNDL